MWKTALRRLLAVAALLGSAAAGAQAPAADCPPVAKPPTAEAVAAGLRDGRDRGFLWRISKDGRVSHLYGTIHVARFDWMFPGPTVLAALRESDVVALEVDLLDPAQQRELAQAAAAARTELAPPLRARIAAMAARECVGSAQIEALPAELQVASLIAMTSRRDGLDPTYGIDLFLAAWSRGAGLPVASLESPAAQIAALRIPDAAQRDAMLGAALDDLDAGRARPLLRRIATMWADSDHAELARYDTWCECRRTDAERAAMARLLDDRNVGLADAIHRLHAAGQRVFAALGSLHFVGGASVQALLERRGYRVERIEWPQRVDPKRR